MQVIQFETAVKGNAILIPEQCFNKEIYLNIERE